MEKISIVRRRLERTHKVETAALRRARSRMEEQDAACPLIETTDPEPREMASSLKVEKGMYSVCPVSPKDEQATEILLGLDQLDALRMALPIEEMEIGESREIPVVVTRASAFKVVFTFGGDGEPLLTTKEVCELLRVSKSFLYRKIHKGLVPCLRIGRRYRFRRKEVMEALTEEVAEPQVLHGRAVFIA